MDAIQAVLPRVLAGIFRQGPLSQAKLEAAWRIAVGDALSRVSQVRLLSDGVVEIHAADQRWHPELKRSSPLILSRLNALLGANGVKQLALKPERLAGPAADRTGTRRPGRSG
jgi:predicted nucleic acid-binding Zn ribbon protein